MRLKIAGLCLLLLSLTTFDSFAQTLFKYGKHKVSKKEFVTALEKNRTNEGPLTEQEVNEYLELYSLFKMRLQSGYDQKINEQPEFEQELNSYKEQLVNSFVYDRTIEDKLITEAVNRSSEERLFAHILLPISKPQDSAKVKSEITTIYNEIKSGQLSFEDAAMQYSKDNGSAANGGRVGYIAPMVVVYDVENEVYNTAKGAISEPFVSPFGYHIIKVLDVRPARGKVQVAQILISKSEGYSLAENVLEQLHQGANFEEMVKLYSSDAFSVEQGGVLQPFGVGQMQESFENAAFALNRPGDISKIVQTDYGFHILKLIEKISSLSKAELETQLKAEIHKDGRSKTVRGQLFEEVLNSYNYQPNVKNIDDLRTLFIQGTSNEFELENYLKRKDVLFHLNGKAYTTADYMSSVHSKTKGRVFGARLNFFEQMYKSYLESLVLDLETDRLSKSNKEFSDLLGEYEQGMVIFSVMEKNVWNKSNDDEGALKKYFDQHKHQYTFGPGFEGVTYTGEAILYLDQLKQLMSEGEDFQKALNKIDAARGQVKFKRDFGKFDYKDFPISYLPSVIEGSFSEIYPIDDTLFQMAYVDKHYKTVSQLEFEDVKGKVSVDYQQDVEKKWNKSLQKKYPLKVKKNVLKSIY